jgi:hypothetical protein
MSKQPFRRVFGGGSNKSPLFSFHKLGWFRLNDAGEPYVQSGDIFLDKVHHARVDSCAEQR